MLLTHIQIHLHSVLLTINSFFWFSHQKTKKEISIQNVFQVLGNKYFRIEHLSDLQNKTKIN